MTRRSPIITIAGKEFRDRLQSGWVVACIIVWLGAISLTSLFGLIQIGRIEFQGYQRTVLSLVNLVQYLVPLLALLLGHDVMVREREERTLALMIASGVSRPEALWGKFLGAALSLIIPLMLGFFSAGVLIAFGAGRQNIGDFVLLTLTSLGLGLVFLAFGFCLSVFCRTQVRSLVMSLLLWGATVFAFDLGALGLWVTLQSPSIAKEIEMLCDPMHVTPAAADLHAAYEASTDARVEASQRPTPGHFSLLWLNPVDLFRALNLSSYIRVPVSPLIFSAGALVWIAIGLGLSFWKINQTDL